MRDLLFRPPTNTAAMTSRENHQKKGVYLNDNKRCKALRTHADKRYISVIIIIIILIIIIIIIIIIYSSVKFFSSEAGTNK